VFVEWEVSTNRFIYHHSESVTIRRFRGTTVLEPKPLWINEFRAHPSGRATLSVRTREGNVCGVRDDCKQTKVRDEGVTSLVDQDIRLDGRIW